MSKLFLSCRGQDGFPGAHPGPAVGHMPVDVVPASQAELQQHLDSSAAAAALQAQALGQDGITDAQVAAIAAAAAAAAEGQAQGTDAGDVAAAAAAAAQLAQLNAEQAQTNAVQAQLTAEQAQQQVDALQQQQVDAMTSSLAAQFNLDPTQAAALAAGAMPVSGGLALDPAQAAALQGLNIAQLGLMDGQQLMLPDGLQLQAHEALYGHHHAPEEIGMSVRSQSSKHLNVRHDMWLFQGRPAAAVCRRQPSCIAISHKGTAGLVLHIPAAA